MKYLYIFVCLYSCAMVKLVPGVEFWLKPVLSTAFSVIWRDVDDRRTRRLSQT